ncbi:MAG: hypothetical protein DHS20C11_22230 [Lysobacteraceae bacterium]|nr:MAG: hypothetical protein DHS20C11_22230 [Xanthomonadaceae bacterium]
MSGKRLLAMVGLLVVLMQLSDQPEMTIAQAALFWLGRVVGLIGSFILAELIVGAYLSGRLGQPAWLKPTLVVTALACVPMTAVELALESAVPQPLAYADDDLLVRSKALWFLAEYFTLLSILAPVNLILWLLIDHRRPRPEQAGDEGDWGLPPFLEKTTIRSVEDVLALQAAEHYVNVHHGEGSELVYLRLSDALTEMPEGLGMQVHRSWWVAAARVQSSRRRGRRWLLIMDNDLQVPVSDTYLKAVRGRGWLRPSPRNRLE